MKKIRVNAGGGYDVFVGKGILHDCGGMIGEILPRCTLAVVSDSNVAPLYLDTVTDSLRRAGFTVCSFVFPAGEGSKNMNTLSDILEFFAESGLTRSDCAVALGGGVTGDMTGFAAGCYMRGIKYIQMPTTLLSAVDSSVGGKTAVDLTAGKNLAGLFIQPAAVLCDTDCLSTLSDEFVADGAAEAVKTGILCGSGLFELFEKEDYKKYFEEIILQCVAYKASIVEADEKESGCRKLLNLGHTAAHAVEALSGYTVPHGHAVAVGTAIIARACCRRELADRIVNVLKKIGLPVTASYPAEELAIAALADKKRSGDSITLIIPEEIGHCVLKDTPVSRLRDIFAAGLEG